METPRRDLLADLAAAFDALVGHGYRPREIKAMTPRAINAALYFAERRRRRHLAEALSHNTMADRADGKDIQREIDRLTA